MDFNADNLKQIYLNWINKSNYTDLKNEWIEIKTPFTDFTGSYIYLFAKKIDDKYYLTDYGNILNELDMHNIQIKGQRKKLLYKILLSQKCNIGNNNDIYIEFFNITDFPKYKHQLIQAIINISDLFLTSKSNIENLFLFDVVEFLDKNEISYSSRPYSLQGKSELTNTFDLNIGQIKKRNIPTLHTRIINRLTDNSMKSLIFATTDLSLDKNEKIATILNDIDNKIDDKKIKILENANIEVIHWKNNIKYFYKYKSA